MAVDPRPAEDLVDSLARRWGWLDAVADPVQAATGWFYDSLGSLGRLLKDLAHGTKPLGHPLHPALTDVPLGAWTVMVVLDLVALYSRAIPPIAGDVALTVGLLGGLAAAVAGLTDYHELIDQERRAGTIHGLVMTTVLVLMAVALVIRLADPAARPGAVWLSTLTYLLSLVGAYVGGHLSFRYGTMVNRNAFYTFPADFSQVGDSADFPEGRLTRVAVDGTPILVTRRQGKLMSIGAVCSHAGGPLDEGEVEENTVICPWHGSRFCLLDGRVEGGPATFNAPAFEVREAKGKVSVRLAQP